MDNNTTLVLGGARSGKSGNAEALALNLKLDLIYVATGEARDDEMRKRIEHHKMQRGPLWKTIEEPLYLSSAIINHSLPENVLLIDCLTLWLSNLLEKNMDIDNEVSYLIDALNKASGAIIFVANEVGQGIVPLNPLAREFRDHAGRLNQQIAANVANVYVITAGLPLPLKENNQLLTRKFIK